MFYLFERYLFIGVDEKPIKMDVDSINEHRWGSNINLVKICNLVFYAKSTSKTQNFDK